MGFASMVTLRNDIAYWTRKIPNLSFASTHPNVFKTHPIFASAGIIMPTMASTGPSAASRPVNTINTICIGPGSAANPFAIEVSTLRRGFRAFSTSIAAGASPSPNVIIITSALAFS